MAPQDPEPSLADLGPGLHTALVPAGLGPMLQEATALDRLEWMVHVLGPVWEQGSSQPFIWPMAPSCATHLVQRAG